MANEALIKKWWRNSWPRLLHTLEQPNPIPTFDMLKRLLEIRSEFNQVLEDLSMNTLITSDWAKLENLVKLLEPFAIHTGELQSDSQSLSQVVPFLLNLEAHLLTIPAAGRQLAQVLLKSLQERFAAILCPDFLLFDGTPAAACLLDTRVSLILQSPDMVPLRKTAQSVVPNLVAQYNPTTTSQNDANWHSSCTTLHSYCSSEILLSCVPYGSQCAIDK